MATQRTYLVRFEGRDRIILAASPKRAERHVLDVELARLEKRLGAGTCVANGATVADFVAAGGRVETEGQMPAAPHVPIIEALASAMIAASEDATEGDEN